MNKTGFQPHPLNSVTILQCIIHPCSKRIPAFSSSALILNTSSLQTKGKFLLMAFLQNVLGKHPGVRESSFKKGLYLLFDVLPTQTCFKKSLWLNFRYTPVQKEKAFVRPLSSPESPLSAETPRKTPIREDDSAAFKMALEASTEGNSLETDLCQRRKWSSPGNRTWSGTPRAPKISWRGKGSSEAGWAVMNFQHAG